MKNKYDWVLKIDRSNLSIQQWAISYLLKNNAFIRSRGNPFETGSVSEIIQGIPETPEKELLMRKMREALAQKRLRDKKDGRKAYNFLMSVQIKEQLKFLAREAQKPMNETLELLISERYQQQKQLQKLAKA